MRKLFTLVVVLALAMLAPACVSKKKYKAINLSNQNLIDQVANLRRAYERCNEAKVSSEGENKALKNSLEHMRDQVSELSLLNHGLLSQMGNLTTISAKDASNLEKSMESIREKDLQIRRMQDALDKKDSVTMALVLSLKGSLSDVNDKDVEVNVEKSVVFISLSDKMLFPSGSSTISPQAKSVLAKVAEVLNGKPEMDVLVEGHTDDQPINKDCIKDNWDLSVLRATAITRVLIHDYHVDPARITAGGHAQFMPLRPNDSPENRSINRRIKIIILPKLDQFYGLIEDGLKQVAGKDE